MAEPNEGDVIAVWFSSGAASAVANDAVSDERLRELEAWAVLVSTFPPREGHPSPAMYAEIASAFTELITHRSVTSQASEGEVVAARPRIEQAQELIEWMRDLIDNQTDGSSVILVQSEKFNRIVGVLANLAAQPQNEALARIHKSRADALQAASPSKRVERLETALQQIKARTYSDDRGCALAADAVAEISDIAIQALQGGRS